MGPSRSHLDPLRKTDQLRRTLGLDRQIKEARRAATVVVTLEEKLAGQKRMKALESERNQKRRTFFESQDEIDRKRGDLIAQLEEQLTQRVASECLFTVRWRVV